MLKRPKVPSNHISLVITSPGLPKHAGPSVWGDTKMELDLSFKPGDVVQLNSGGPKMTVVAVLSDGTMRCTWFNDDGRSDSGVFPQAGLRAAKTKN
jgi:uncharacterized protein YodC (DUF2158 family)